jgi:hypothetical protein
MREEGDVKRAEVRAEGKRRCVESRLEIEKM